MKQHPVKIKLRNLPNTWKINRKNQNSINLTDQIIIIIYYLEKIYFQLLTNNIKLFLQDKYLIIIKVNF